MSARRKEIEGWAAGQPWLDIGVVIIAGWIPEAIEIVRAHRPDVDVIVFDPDREGEDGEGYLRVYLYDSIRHRLGVRRWIHLDVALLCPPEMQGGHLQPIQEMIIAGEQLARGRHMTISRNVEQWSRIGLESLELWSNCAPIQALGGSCAGRHGLIVGAGPSLNQAMMWLPGVADRLVIAATETSLPILDRYGVSPDFVIAVEALESAYRGLDDLAVWKDAILVPGVHAWPGVYRYPARAICPAMQAIGPVGTWVCEGLGLQSIDSGGSVATVAYSVLQRLGCTTISGIGIDSAYGPVDAMRAYADGVIGRDKPPKAHEQLEAFGGAGTVASSPQLKTYRDWFATQARHYGDLWHINLSVGGARIPGWQEQELCDWAETVKREHQPAGLLELPTEPMDLSWAAASLETQLAGVAKSAELARAALEATEAFGAAVAPLGQLPRDPEAQLIAKMQYSPLEVMRMMPTQYHMQAAFEVNRHFMDLCARVAPVVTVAIERMKARYARAAA